MVVDADGNVYVIGQSQGNIVTIKYDTYRNQLWIRYHDEPYACWVVGGVFIGMDDSNNVYVIGDCTSKMGDYDCVTIKYDNDGNKLWVRHYDGPASSHDSARSLAVDSAGNVYVTGGSDDGDGLSNYATVRCDAYGYEIWVSRYEGLTGTDCYPREIAVDGFGNVYVTGWMWLYSDKAGWDTVAYDMDGNELWAAHYGNESVNDMAL
ncbi:MAG: SBBP repeat-containing protein [Chloroflexota bacterium]|nr:SBBP repeat-containing protein [Chloroflexota bacterium]